ncbi:MAG TPA: hypothetical protein DCY03_31755 [Planctomycetaceae bacterium]|nr:hypothetical protein [Planctomycetaceae bacterium]|tara:strand:+ start:2840 stop:4141 length:1302 start_codon:yes stop_codon:yes gene_type:complete
MRLLISVVTYGCCISHCISGLLPVGIFPAQSVEIVSTNFVLKRRSPRLMFDFNRCLTNRIQGCLLIGLLILLSGCGKMISNSATEQLLTSDAVDQTISHLDFSTLANKKVYFDTSYIKNIKGVGFVNGDYIISSLRQQIVAANCLIQEKKEDADYVIEARVGTLATNGHEVNYGIPASNMLSSAATLMPAAPAIPTIPEISLAKKNNQTAAAKISVFAYNQKTRERVWQSGVLQAKSTARDTWILGAGPFQRGTIYKDGAQFAGAKIEIPLGNGEEFANDSTVDYLESARFVETPVKSEIKQETKKRDVKTLEEWIKAETAGKEKKKEASAKKSDQPKIEPVAAQKTQAAGKSTKQAKSELEIEPSKIKTVLFLQPEKANGHHDWLQGDTSRISTVWPQSPEKVQKAPVTAPEESESLEIFEVDETFRKIISD